MSANDNADLGRWNGVDALGEKYASWSQYAYTMNDPINFIDQDGNSRDHFGNVTYQGFAAVDENGFIGGVEADEPKTRTNVAIALESADFLKGKTREYDRGTWHIIMAETFMEAKETLGDYLGKNQIDNLVIFTHGNPDGGVIYPNGNTDQALKPQHINTYVTGRSRNIKGSGFGYETIKALDGIVNYVKENGNVLFSTCWACHGESGKSMASSLSRLTQQRVNLYLNQDPSMRRYYNGYVEIWTGKPLTSELREGWVKVDRSGSILELKGHENLRGNIRLDSRTGHEPIKLE